MEIENTNQIDTRWQEHQNFFGQYLANSTNTDAINRMLTNNETRLVINLDDIRQNHNPQIADDIISYPQKAISALRGTLNKIIDNIDHDGLVKKKKMQDITEKVKVYQIAFNGNMGRNHVTPRGLNCSLINKLVCIDGIVTRMSVNRSKLIRSVHYCEEILQGGPIKDYEDVYDLGATTSLNPNNTIPKSHEQHPLSLEYGYSKFKDFQTIIVQELPENAPNGLLPRSIDVVLEEDLVGSVKPGDRVRIYGVYKCIKSEQTKSTGIMRSVLVCTSIGQLSQENDDVQLTTEDLQYIKKISKRKDLVDIFVNSIAPSIYGHQQIKKALLLQLLGGTEKTVGQGTHLRGDINIMMIGDPSTAKSQVLRYMLATAPLALNTTGRGSSGVGLTAAVKTDRETGERHLEAGAMVLADKGVVCIDEFDKMSEEDRVAIHEVMEQQTVTIAKAGIHCSLNARCSVLAAANPIYGEYHRDQTPTKNIGLPDSLLSRFDLLFIVLDEKDPDIDRLIAERVTRNHRYRPENYEIINQLSQFQGDENDEYIIEPTVAGDANENKAIFEKYNKVLHGDKKKEILNQNFLKKYIAYAKKTFNSPKLSDESIEYINLYYNQLRQKNFQDSTTNGGVKVLPVTTRTLETVIRLATASAKLRLSKNIEISDCRLATSLLNYALFNKEDAIRPEEEEFYEEDEDYKQDRRQNGNKKETQPKSVKKQTNTTVQPPVQVTENKRESRSASKAIAAEQQAQKSTTPLKEKQDKREIKNQMKKIRIDDDDDVDKVFSQQIIASIKITDEQKKAIFKIVSKLAKDKSITKDQLWKHIQGNQDLSKIITSSPILDRAIIELQDDEKIFYDASKQEIYPY
ncbi:DNA replication licensing factor MCM4 (macronuclear) [Tetrahymena thermophila SB210]|uniref:DNA replication licensing factor MCM3 n=1 Tax=Tetrahymena thermophila (strain SB210) TaxID=312017 RepID=Q236A7_TETTS|nr:DNA replication licensing factor MCM4 [Tetrahymena thermophila SB210]EAR92593.1 DNA replication licensing factor MCM4 [Tetrahymena thermophila SB210]|eukprot:XP_001012838.1 DNA replication licensing factor MCM4 [Tetrahymena thermophila SB210]